MPDGIDPAMNQVKRTTTKARVDRTPANPALDELPASHNPMLALRQRRNHRIRAASSVFVIA
jgi:hypothetical protein